MVLFKLKNSDPHFHDIIIVLASVWNTPSLLPLTSAHCEWGPGKARDLALSGGPVRGQ